MVTSSFPIVLPLLSDRGFGFFDKSPECLICSALATPPYRAESLSRDWFPFYSLFCRYCVEFEVLKASKACRKEQNYGALKEGEQQRDYVIHGIVLWPLSAIGDNPTPRVINRLFFRRENLRSLRDRGAAQELGLALSGPWSWGSCDPLVRAHGTPLSREMVEGAGGTGPEVRRENLPTEFRFHFRLNDQSEE